MKRIVVSVVAMLISGVVFADPATPALPDLNMENAGPLLQQMSEYLSQAGGNQSMPYAALTLILGIISTTVRVIRRLISIAMTAAAGYFAYVFWPEIQQLLAQWGLS